MFLLNQRTFAHYTLGTGFLPAFPVKNLTNFTSDKTGGVFRDCMLLPPKTTMREFARLVDPSLDKYYAYTEGLSGQRVRLVN